MLGKSQAKYIQSLGQKKFRDEAGYFIAEGPKIIEELLLTARQNVQQIYALPEWSAEHRASIGNIELHEINEKELDRISLLSTPNRVLAVVKKFQTKDLEDMRGRVSLGLDTIQDPGNLGTIIRIADWFGIRQIVCSVDCADMYNPKVVQSTMGSIARVQVVYTHLEQWLDKNKDLPVYAAALDGEDISGIGKIRKGLILIGNESKGISTALLERTTTKITIPKKGGAESLNAAVAAGIIVSHLV